MKLVPNLLAPAALMSSGLLLAPAAALATPATPGNEQLSEVAATCVQDDASADMAARVFAASRVCPWMLPASDDLVPNLAILFGAVRASDVAEPSCRAVFEAQASAEWQGMQNTSTADQTKICDDVQRLVKPRRQLKATLMRLKVMKPVPQDPY